MKRVLSVQDISCVGKCSLTVALPILSAAGIETAILPTAVLSTHTQFKRFTFRDLTDDLQMIVDHWLEEKLTFDGVYTGYLGSVRQIEIVENILEKFPGELHFVDPAMADNGKLYCGFDEKFARRMGKLCEKADIIVPNLTEAAFMLSEKYLGDSYSEEDLKNLLRKLTVGKCGIAVLTGVQLAPGKCGIMGYEKAKDRFFRYDGELQPASFHGTGDIYSSAAFAAMMYGKPADEAMAIAVDYTVECIKLTIKHANHNWYGVDFEAATGKLLELLKK